MATRAELMREIKRLRGVAESQFSRIDTAIQKGRLPKSAKGTYFYQEYQRLGRTNMTVMTRKLTGKDVHIKNAELEKMVSQLTRFTESETATQVGIRENLSVKEQNANYVLNTYAGLDDDEIETMTRKQKSKFFQLAEMLQEELEYESDTAYIVIANTMRNTGKTSTELLREYQKALKEDMKRPRAKGEDTRVKEWYNKYDFKKQKRKKK